MNLVEHRGRRDRIQIARDSRRCAISILCINWLWKWKGLVAEVSEPIGFITGRFCSRSVAQSARGRSAVTDVHTPNRPVLGGRHGKAHHSRCRRHPIAILGFLTIYGSIIIRRGRQLKPGVPPVRSHIFPYRAARCMQHAQEHMLCGVQQLGCSTFRHAPRGDRAPILVHVHQPCAADQPPRLSERARAIRARRSCVPRNGV